MRPCGWRWVVGAALAVQASAAPLHLRHSHISSGALSEPITLERRSGSNLKPNEGSGTDPGSAGDGAIKKNVDVIRKQADDTLGRVKRVSVADTVRGDVDLLRKYFLPGFEFRPDIFVTMLVIVVSSIAWFCTYFWTCYEDDRGEDLKRWGMEPGAVDVDPAVLACPHIKPDLILVFHHPSHEYGDREAQATHGVMQRALVAEVDSWKVVATSGEVPVRVAPRADARKVGVKAVGDTIRGQAEGGWVALAGEDGYVSVLVEEGEEPPKEGGPAAPKELPAERQPALQLMQDEDTSFRQVRRLMKDAFTWETAMTPIQHLSRARSAFSSPAAGAEEEGEEAEPIPAAPTRLAARVALLQDLYEALPKWGFDVALFSSIDDDELFVCISLLNDEAQNSYLLRQSSCLQIRKEVVKRLGICQPPDEIVSSPPRIRFDPRIVKNLHDAGVLASDDPREFFDTFHGRDSKGCIVSGKDRFRMIFKELCNRLDLDAAKHDGLIVDWFPCHSEKWLQKLDASWASYRRLFDMTFVQPISMIQDYFGSRVAFIFAWNGLYCKSLLALSVLAIAIEIGAAFFKEGGSGTAHHTVNRRIVLSFGIVLTIWARTTYNMWLREEEFFLKLWDLNPEGQEQTIRPSFQGVSMPSPADLNMMEKQYPAHQASYRRMCSGLVTIIFCAIVALVMVIWYDIFEDNMNIVASIVLAITITIFSVIYNVLVPILTDWENHKFQSTYYNSILWKQFLFQSVNRYFAFFQLSVKQRYTETGCPAQGCLSVIRGQLISTLIILSLTRIVELIIASAIVRFKIWLEDFCLRRSKKEGEDQNIDQRSFIELQSKFGEARLQEQIQTMLQLVLSLGFVLLFGPVAPIIVPCSLAVFMVQLRATAFQWLKYTKRTLPRQQFGIGLWRSIVSSLMHISILFTGFLVAVYGDTFAGMPVITRVAGVVLYVGCMQVVCLLVDLLVPRSSAEVKTLADRRRRVQSVVMKRAESYSHGAGSPKAPGGRGGGGAEAAARRVEVKAVYEDEVAAGEWKAIPHLQSAEYSKMSSQQKP